MNSDLLSHSAHFFSRIRFHVKHHNWQKVSELLKNLKLAEKNKNYVYQKTLYLLLAGKHSNTIKCGLYLSDHESHESQEIVKYLIDQMGQEYLSTVRYCGQVDKHLEYYNPFHLAAKYDQIEIVRYLLEKNTALMYELTNLGHSALALSAQSNSLQVLSYLLQRDSSSPWIEQKNYRQQNLLELTIEANQLQSAHKLLTTIEGLDIDNFSHHSNALIELLKQKTIAIAPPLSYNYVFTALKDTLILKTKDLNKINESGYSSLFFALELEHYDIACELLVKGASALRVGPSKSAFDYIEKINPTLLKGQKLLILLNKLKLIYSEHQELDSTLKVREKAENKKIKI